MLNIYSDVNLKNKNKEHNLNEKQTLTYNTTLFFLSIFVIFSYLILKELFQYATTQPVIVSELLSATFSTIITVAAMSVMLKFQSKQDKDKEYASQLFDRKLSIYIDLLYLIFEADDDNYISYDEIIKIENKIGTACLISNENLVSTFSQFMIQLKIYGVIYYRSMDKEQHDHFSKFIKKEKNRSDIHNSSLARQKFKLSLDVEGNESIYFLSLDDIVQDIREDLAIIGGDVKDEIEHFITMDINKYNMMKNPNIVNKNYGKNYVASKLEGES